jgi:pyruvate dehydrogenase E1 component beta subunit
MNGCRPIVEYMTLILFVGIDQIINNAAKMRQMTGGQFNAYRFSWSNSFGRTIRSNHSQALENWFANTPVLKL